MAYANTTHRFPLHFPGGFYMARFKTEMVISLSPNVALEGQQQVLRATFPGIRDSVRVLLEVRMDRLALKFHETKDLKVRDEIYRLAGELIKLDESWVFVAS